MVRFGRNLEAARIMANYEHASDFAKMLKIKDQAYRKYERGESMPPPDLLVDIRALLGVSLDWLIANEPISSAPPQEADNTKSDAREMSILHHDK
jgi:transcriptional regulator with XRE-family HTH domain